jgi:hypothetical protein
MYCCKTESGIHSPMYNVIPRINTNLLYKYNTTRNKETPVKSIFKGSKSNLKYPCTSTFNVYTTNINKKVN